MFGFAPGCVCVCVCVCACNVGVSCIVLWIDQVSGETKDFVYNGSLDLSLEWETSPKR